MASSIEGDVSTFVRLDTELKQARKEMKTARDACAECKKRIIKFMKDNKIDKMEGIAGGTQYLTCTKKEIKIRPTSEQMQAALAEAMSKGIKDPGQLLEIIQSCAGTKEEYRLFRRTVRITTSAAAIVGAALKPSATAKKPKKKKPKLVKD